MTRAPWKSYVERLCDNAWSFDDRATSGLLAGLEALSVTEDFTNQDVSAVLRAAGVRESAANLVAPSIRVAMIADKPRRVDSE